MHLMNEYSWSKKLNRPTKLSIVLIVIIFCSFFLSGQKRLKQSLRDYEDSLEDPGFPINDLPDCICNEDLNPFSSTIPLLTNPILMHKANTTEYFITNHYINESVQSIMNRTYYRRTNKTGSLVDDRIYSLDNLMYYWGFLGEYATVIYTFILELINSKLYSEENITTYQYGFIESVNESGGDIHSIRYLIDNLALIFPLIESSTWNDIVIEPLEKQLKLLNSSEFWDDQYGGFVTSNSSTTKYAHENFLAAYANILWHRYKNDNRLNFTDRAEYLYINVTSQLYGSNMWDSNYNGFNYQCNLDWDSFPRNSNKSLKTNALGIIALTESYLESNKYNETALNVAEILYDKISKKLINNSFDYPAYENFRSISWGEYHILPNITLEDNAWYLMALIHLFKATSNVTYYNDAVDLFNFIETYMRDEENGGYYYSIGKENNTDKDLYANSVLMRAHLEMSEIFESTTLGGSLNDTTLIKGEETLNLTCTYKFYNVFDFVNPAVTDLTLEAMIEDANITYIMRYPNETIIDIIKPANTDENGNQSISYSFSDDFPDGTYSIAVYANRTYRATAFKTFYFSLSSGLMFDSGKIEGLGNGIYQGETLETNLTIVSVRVNDTFLTVSWQSDYFANDDKIVNFSGESDTKFTINITANPEAEIGLRTVNFYVKNGSKEYLTFSISILIKQSVNVLLFSYKSEILQNESIPISITLKNYLSNNSQSVKIRFFGDDFQDVIYDVQIETSATKVSTFDIMLFENLNKNSTKLFVNVTKGLRSIYYKEFDISIIQPIEIESATFTSAVYQGQMAFLIIKITNNRNVPINFTLYINNLPYPTNINQIGYGENEIISVITPTINPYDFQTKEYKITLKDSSGNVFFIQTFETAITLSVLNLIIFYIAPIAVPIVIFVLYKNKEVKSRILEA